MLVVNLNNNDEMNCKIHCILCGSDCVNDKGDINSCNHLIYIGSNEIDTEPIFDKNKLLDLYFKNDRVEDEFMFDYLKDNLNDNYLCIILNEPGPVPGNIYYIFKV